MCAARDSSARGPSLLCALFYLFTLDNFDFSFWLNHLHCVFFILILRFRFRSIEIEKISDQFHFIHNNLSVQLHCVNTKFDSCWGHLLEVRKSRLSQDLKQAFIKTSLLYLVKCYLPFTVSPVV